MRVISAKEAVCQQRPSVFQSRSVVLWGHGSSLLLVVVVSQVLECDQPFLEKAFRLQRLRFRHLQGTCQQAPADGDSPAGKAVGQSFRGDMAAISCWYWWSASCGMRPATPGRGCWSVILGGHGGNLLLVVQVLECNQPLLEEGLNQQKPLVQVMHFSC